MNNIGLFPVQMHTSPAIKALTQVMNKQFNRMKTEVYDNLYIFDLKKAPDELLNHLALQFKADGFEFARTREEKEKLVINALDVRLHSGTLYALKTLFSAININCEIEQWYEYTPEGNPYTFKIELLETQREIHPGLQHSIAHVIETYKNKRSHMEDLKLAYMNQVPCIPGTCLTAAAGCSVTTKEFYEEDITAPFPVLPGSHGVLESTAAAGV